MEIVISHMNAYIQEYKEWRSLPEANNKWNHFQYWWQEKYDIKKETVIPAASMGYINFSVERILSTVNNILYKETIKIFGKAFTTNSILFLQISEANH